MDEETLLPSAPLTPEDEALQSLFRNLEKNSLETLEAAARQIITLVTTLLGLFFGVLALKDDPAYLSALPVKALAALALGAFLAALFLALDVVLPRLQNYNRRDLTEMRRLYAALLRRKSGSLRRAQRAFGLGALLLFGLILTILL